MSETVKHHTPFWSCFLLAALVATLVFAALQYSFNKSTERELRYLTLSKSKEITEAIYELLFKTEALATLVIQGDGKIQDFDKIAPVMLNKPAIRNILVAPDGVVANVYPLHGNEKLLGFDMFSEGVGNREALLARETGKLTLGGPFKGVQGGESILVGRLPVYLGHNDARKLWGLVSVTLNFPQVLESVRLEDLEKQGYACEIWRINPDTGQRQIILASGAPLHDAMEKTFDMFNAQWVISIAPIHAWYQSTFFYSYVAVALLVCLLLGFSVQNYNDMSHLKNSMQKMAMEDTLTGLPNRRAAFDELRARPHCCRRQDDFFVLAYMDLNLFKAINDTYGHQVGDLVLQEASRRLRAALGPEAFISRIGGDEFIVIVQGTSGGMDAVHTAFDRVKAAMRVPMPYKNEQLHFSVSIGYAVYPSATTDVEKLAVMADQAMYEDKEKEHARMAAEKAQQA